MPLRSIATVLSGVARRSPSVVGRAMRERISVHEVSLIHLSIDPIERR